MYNPEGAPTEPPTFPQTFNVLICQLNRNLDDQYVLSSLSYSMIWANKTEKSEIIIQENGMAPIDNFPLSLDVYKEEEQVTWAYSRD